MSVLIARKTPIPDDFLINLLSTNLLLPWLRDHLRNRQIIIYKETIESSHILREECFMIVQTLVGNQRKMHVFDYSP